MSREILFKTKRKNWRELPKEEWWVEGYYCKWQQIRRPLCIIEEKEVDCIITWMSDGGMSRYEIDPETLCQYTGLTDKNGKRIWENGIVMSKASEDERDWKLWKVVFVDGAFVFVPLRYAKKTRKKIRCEDELLCEDNINLYGLECVGNIFDNTELSGGAE
ncbi:YopX family protein [Mediterraneibacter hominis]|uniref:YopX family protein n=1 Tax=Mediterraneibacter hominis TaxID=2763054 RepID=UPI001FACD210|nr:YopX family protein [Mediterraneibacter hominis]